MLRAFSALLLVAFAGCYSANKATKQVSKALQRHPQVVAQIAREAFPCIVLKADTIINDRLISVACPASIVDSVIILGRDTIRTTAIRYVKVPVNLPQITIYKSIEDSAKVFILSNILNEANTQNEEQKLQLKKNKKLIKILWIILACLSVPLIYKIIK